MKVSVNLEYAQAVQLHEMLADQKSELNHALMEAGFGPSQALQWDAWDSCAWIAENQELVDQLHEFVSLRDVVELLLSQSNNSVLQESPVVAKFVEDHRTSLHWLLRNETEAVEQWIVRHPEMAKNLAAFLQHRERLEAMLAPKSSVTARSSFVAFVEQHEENLLHICKAIKRNGHDARDLQQDVFLMLYEKWPRLAEFRKLDREAQEKWLFKTALRHSISIWRVLSNHNADLLRWDSVESIPPPSGEPNQDLLETVEDKEKLGILISSVKKQDHRVALLLNFHFGFDRHEIAYVMEEESVGLVNVWLTRGKQEIQKIINKA